MVLAELDLLLDRSQDHGYLPGVGVVVLLHLGKGVQVFLYFPQDGLKGQEEVVWVVTFRGVAEELEQRENLIELVLPRVQRVDATREERLSRQ